MDIGQLVAFIVMIVSGAFIFSQIASFFGSILIMAIWGSFFDSGKEKKSFLDRVLFIPLLFANLIAQAFGVDAVKYAGTIVGITLVGDIVVVIAAIMIFIAASHVVFV